MGHPPQHWLFPRALSVVESESSFALATHPPSVSMIRMPNCPTGRKANHKLLKAKHKFSELISDQDLNYYHMFRFLHSF